MLYHTESVSNLYTLQILSYLGAVNEAPTGFLELMNRETLPTFGATPQYSALREPPQEGALLSHICWTSRRNAAKRQHSDGKRKLDF